MSVKHILKYFHEEIHLIHRMKNYLKNYQTSKIIIKSKSEFGHVQHEFLHKHL